MFSRITRKRSFMGILVLFLVAVYTSSCAQEHPTKRAGLEEAEHPEEAKEKEHPEKKEQKEHPEQGKQKIEKEHPEEGEQKGEAEHQEKSNNPDPKEVTLEDVARFAENYVQENSQDGVYRHYYRDTGKWLELTLDKIHRERLSQTGKNEYFVCADFRGRDGNLYDLDLFVRGADPDNLQVDKTSISVHKVNGKEVYTWFYNKKKGIWEKKYKEVKKETPEHPSREHP